MQTAFDVKVGKLTEMEPDTTKREMPKRERYSFLTIGN